MKFDVLAPPVVAGGAVVAAPPVAVVAVGATVVGDDEVLLDPQPATMAATACGPTGGSQPHNNLMPFLALNYVIAMQGVFPPRS